jgi:hypothetical protein
MFAVTIAFGNQSWRLLYKTEEAAQGAYAALTQPIDKTHDFNAQLRMAMVDDFGQKACFLLSAIIGAMLENLDESKLGTIEMGLHQQRTQAAFQARVENDPTIRAAAAMRQQGPSILIPMGNGRLS